MLCPQKSELLLSFFQLGLLQISHWPPKLCHSCFLSSLLRICLGVIQKHCWQYFDHFSPSMFIKIDSLWTLTHPFFVNVVTLTFFFYTAKHGGWILACCRKFSIFSIFVHVAYDFFPCRKNVFHAALTGIDFKDLDKIFQKMPIMKNSCPN